MFLPDRFVKGECPKCHAQDQYGDNCEVCGTTYSPTELINPYSAVSGAKPELRESEHFFSNWANAPTSSKHGLPATIRTTASPICNPKPSTK